MKMMARYLDKGHRIYMDRYYSSSKLYDALTLRITSATGTVNKNRKGFPKKEGIKKS